MQTHQSYKTNEQNKFPFNENQYKVVSQEDNETTYDRSLKYELRLSQIDFCIMN